MAPLRQHRLAVVSLWIVVAFYLVALLAEFVAPYAPSAYNARYTYAAPQGIHFFATADDGSLEFGPFVYGYRSEIDRAAMRRTLSTRRSSTRSASSSRPSPTCSPASSR